MRPDENSHAQVPCKYETFDWHALVEDSQSKVQNKFDGLCLDCMDSTKNLRLRGDSDEEYWIYTE